MISTNSNLSISLIYYIKNSKFVLKKKNKVYLIDSNKLKNIYNDYVEFIKINGLSMPDNIENEDFNIICNDTKDYIDDENNKSNNSDDKIEEDSYNNII